jgi:predicted DNA-binding antitoxin AbrB/MazE fold protein
MREQIEVIYEDGVLRPLGPLPAQVHEHQRYTVTIENLNGGETAAAARDANPAASLEDVRRALAKVSGTLAEHARAERNER